MVKEEISLSKKIVRLETMQKLFKYWHVAHCPLLIMLVIVVIHIGVTLAFGYKWIFLKEVLIEQLFVYGSVFLFCANLSSIFTLRKRKKLIDGNRKKVAIAKEEGLFEPVSLHPHIDLNTCIGSGACIAECPEKDILGIVDGIATVINTSNCVGHGACFHACPVEAISLEIGTEKRGVDLPHVNRRF